eukprot:m.337527 g.337527  ORF g.337527 m.337527 type:complete len:545 (-) comp18157_c0_seq1:1152-2786(-)
MFDLLVFSCAIASVSAARNYDVSDTLNIQWEVDNTKDIITFTLQTTVKAEWIGLGIGEPGSGSMPGADIALVYKENGKYVVKDTYCLDYVLPTTDQHQDWTLINAEELTSGGLKAQISRPLQTEDVHYDRSLDKSSALPNTLIFAYGSLAGGNVQYHGGNRWRLNINLFLDINYQKELMQKSDFDTIIVALNKNFSVPSDETTYNEQNLFLDNDEYMMKLGDRTIIGIEPVVSEETESMVHHFLLYGMRDDDEGDLIFGGASHASAVVFPDSAGVNANDFLNIRLQTHYNNPSGITGKVDSSGMKFYVTKAGKSRAERMALLQLGDPSVALGGNELVGVNSRYLFECKSLPANTNVNFFARLGHMHQKGAKFVTKYYRDNKEVRTDQIEFYDFGYQDMTFMNWTAQPGDRITTECYYADGKGVRFGLGSKNEMCIDFIYVYPSDKLDTLFCGYEAGDGILVSKEVVDSITHDFGSGSSPQKPKHKKQDKENNTAKYIIIAIIGAVLVAVLAGAYVTINFLYRRKHTAKFSQLAMEANDDDAYIN